MPFFQNPKFKHQTEKKETNYKKNDKRLVRCTKAYTTRRLRKGPDQKNQLYTTCIARKNETFLFTYPLN